MPVRRRLLLLAFSLLVPAVIACGIAVLFTYSHERQRSEENLLRTAQALAESVDRELDSIVFRLQALATSPSLQSGDMQAFWQQASEAVREDGMWVVLITQGGQQVLNTLKPFGEPLPHHTAESSIGHVVEHIFSRKSPSVSDVFTGPVTGKPTLGIAVPVTGRNGEILYGLFMGILPSALKNVVSSASLPKEWLAAAFDTQPVIVARSRDPEPYIGTAPVPVLVQAMASSAAGIINANSREGQPTRVAYSRSPKYGWYFAVGVPKAELAAAVFQTILLFLAIALALLTIGAVLALGFGRSLSRAITSLVPIARGLEKGERVAPHSTDVLEVDQVSLALVHAGNALHAMEAERRQAEEAVRAAKERAEEILSSITDGFYALDWNWRFSYVNGRAQQILGKTPEEMLGFPFFDLFPQVRGTVVHENYRHVMAQRLPRQFDFISPILKRWTSFSVYPAGDGGIAVYFRDISTQKATEAELVAAKEEAERANFAKSQFLASASHDLRQPVQSLFFFHEILSGKLKEHPCARILAHMQSGLDALKSLLDGLLDISRLHAGAVELETSVFPCATLLKRMRNDYAAASAAQGISLRVVESSAWVYSDMVQLERILRNLLDNAIKYTGKGGRVLLGCRHAGSNLRIEVADTGPGIPEEKLETIFEEFVQLTNPERDRAKGLGLGLAIVRQLGRLLDHTIKVRSRLGHGTTFTVTLPLAKAKRNGKPPLAPLPMLADGGLALIVDDETLVLGALRLILEGWGWEVLAATTGSEALRLVEGSPHLPDVIVADYRLRGNETGLKAIHDIHGVCGISIPAIVLTGDTSPERIVECRQSGFRLVHKPINAHALQKVLAEIWE